MAIRYMMDINANYGEAKEFIFSMIEDIEPFERSGATINAVLYYKSSVGGGTYTSLIPTNSISEIGSTGFYTLTLTSSEMSPSNGENDYMILRLSIGANGSSGAVTQININLAPIPADLKEIDGLDTDGNNATLYLKQLNCTNSSGTGIVAHSSSGGHGIEARSDTDNGFRVVGDDYGMYAFSSNGIGLNAESGLSHGARFISSGGAGSGLLCQGNDTGRGIQAFSPNGSGFEIQGKNGLSIFWTGNPGNGIQIQSSAPGKGNAIYASGDDGAGLAIFGTGEGKHAIVAQALTNASGFYCVGNGNGNAASFISGATGSGIVINAQSGHAIFASCTGVNHVLTLSNLGTGNAINANAAGNTAGVFDSNGGGGHGLSLQGDGAGAGITIAGGPTGNGIQAAGAKGLLITGLTSFGTEIISNASHGLYIHSNNVNGYGAFISGRNGIYFESFLGHGIYSEVKTGDGHAFYLKANGLGNGINSEGNIGLRSQGAVEGVLMSGTLGLKIQGTSNYGLEIQSSSNTGVYINGGANYGLQIDGQINGVYINGIAGNAIWARSTGANGTGILSTGNGTGSGFKATKGDTGTYDIQAQELIDIESKIDVIDQNVDDVETLSNTIDGKCNTIINTTNDTNTIVTNTEPTISDTNSKVTSIESVSNLIKIDTTTIDGKMDTSLTQTADIQNKVNDTKNTVEIVESIVENIDTTTQDTNGKVDTMQPLVSDTNAKVTNMETTVQDTNTKVTSMETDIGTIDGTTQDTNTRMIAVQTIVNNINNEMMRLDSQIDGVNLQTVMEHIHSMVNGRIQYNFPSTGQATFFKRDSVTPAFVLQSSEFERARV